MREPTILGVVHRNLEPFRSPKLLTIKILTFERSPCLWPIPEILAVKWHANEETLAEHQISPWRIWPYWAWVTWVPHEILGKVLCRMWKNLLSCVFGIVSNRGWSNDWQQTIFWKPRISLTSVDPHTHTHTHTLSLSLFPHLILDDALPPRQLT